MTKPQWKQSWEVFSGCDIFSLDVDCADSFRSDEREFSWNFRHLKLSVKFYKFIGNIFEIIFCTLTKLGKRIQCNISLYLSYAYAHNIWQASCKYLKHHTLSDNISKFSTLQLKLFDKFPQSLFPSAASSFSSSLQDKMIFHVYWERFLPPLRYHDDSARLLRWKRRAAGENFLLHFAHIIFSSSQSGARHGNPWRSATSFSCMWFSLTITQFMFMLGCK